MTSNRPDGEKGQFSSAAGTADASTTVNDKHQPGKLVGNDIVPEFSAQTLPPGSAPASRTFEPNTTNEAPPVQRYMKDGVRDPESETTNAADTIQGATSADVHTGLGHPGAGQSSKELRHDGQPTRNNPGSSLDGLKSGAGQGTIDPHDPGMSHQRALDSDEAVAGRSDVPSAEELIPESAETVARER